MFNERGTNIEHKALKKGKKYVSKVENDENGQAKSAVL
jgi:hypothetical protein